MEAILKNWSKKFKTVGKLFLLPACALFLMAGQASATQTTIYDYSICGSPIDGYIQMGEYGILFKDRYEWIRIGYDSTDWGSINSATFSVKMSDDFDLFGDWKTEWQGNFPFYYPVPVFTDGYKEYAQITGFQADGCWVGAMLDLNYGFDNNSSSIVEVDGKVCVKNWYWNIDVSDYMLLGGDHTLDALLKAVGGDFEYHNAKLVVDYDSPSSGPAPVPEPATLFLLGTGLIGVAAFVKKLKK